MMADKTGRDRMNIEQNDKKAIKQVIKILRSDNGLTEAETSNWHNIKVIFLMTFAMLMAVTLYILIK